MYECYYDPIMVIPIKRYSEPYASYDKRLMDFFYEYMKKYSVRRTLFRNFWDVVKDDFSKDPNYRYFLKLLYRTNIDWSLFRYKGDEFKKITKKLPRKKMLAYEEHTFPFLRLRHAKNSFTIII